MTANTERFADS